MGQNAGKRLDLYNNAGRCVRSQTSIVGEVRKLTIHNNRFPTTEILVVLLDKIITGGHPHNYSPTQEKKMCNAYSQIRKNAKEKK